MTTLEELLDLRKIREWGAAKPPNSTVGMCNSFTGCPVASYIRQTTRKRRVRAGYGEVHVTSEVVETPLDVRRLMMRIDDQGSDEPCTAGEMVSYIDQILEEE